MTKAPDGIPVIIGSCNYWRNPWIEFQEKSLEERVQPVTHSGTYFLKKTCNNISSNDFKDLFMESLLKLLRKYVMTFLMIKFSQLFVNIYRVYLGGCLCSSAERYSEDKLDDQLNQFELHDSE